MISINEIPYQRQIFLSTLSLRRATAGKHAQQPTQQDFYPRSPCGERLDYYAVRYILTFISIHALLAESDVDYYAVRYILTFISIHALLAESDPG